MTTPEFVAAVRPIIAWGREHGWYRDIYPRHYRNRTHKVIADDCDGWVAVRTWTEGDERFVRDLGRFRVETPQQAIDVLCGLGVLPDHLSAAWHAGVKEGVEASANMLRRVRLFLQRECGSE